jgi:hypothetical protein
MRQGPASSNLGVDFIDIALAYGTTTFAESIANDGSIPTTSAITLTGDTFTISTTGAIFTQGIHYTVTNLPAGLSMVITAVDSTHATVSVSGNATSHVNADDIATLTITWNNAAFTNALAANVIDYNKSNFIVDFADQAAIVTWTGTFTETSTNTGAVSGSRIATISGDTFVNAGGTLAENTHFTVTNKPAGLVAVINVNGAGTTATLTFTGNASYSYQCSRRSQPYGNIL